MIKPIAFYLPQFHPVKENSEWWGPGFTEWTNVAKARPNYEGHYQPQIPRDLGFYDLRMPETFQAQVELAKQNSIFGFCFYYYWFSGRRILETPIDVFFNSDIDFPFCFCWANENWTKRWDGGNNEILLENEHSVENDNQFIENVFDYMRDGRYITYDGSPVIVVYRPDILTNSKRTFDHWRKRAKEEGFPGLFIVSVAFFVHDPKVCGADALVEFPPHQYLANSFIRKLPHITNPDFRGNIMDYRSVMAESINRQHDDFLFFHGAMPAWDNTARRQNDGFTFANASPELFEYWLRRQSDKTLFDDKNKEKFVFINAWNEWAEGAHLEPCLKYGHRHLQAVKRAVQVDRYMTPNLPINSAIEALGAIDSYERDDVRYFTELEYSYHEALNELAQFKSSGSTLKSSFVSDVANGLRSNPVVYKFARSFYRAYKKIAR
ncbi:glycoside hydrolase family 99-like domain-containing protein [Ochrobactrum teleogrylli]|uniref:glycosyltransferase WbsX family protein n=1 Tax=Ochrobactrum teleogrylli TaxID=2479765 RepID=UPI00384B604E